MNPANLFLYVILSPRFNAYICSQKFDRDRTIDIIQKRQ